MRVTKLPSPATAVACTSLLMASTGTALASGLITGKQIKNSSITGADVRNKSLTRADFRGSVKGTTERGDCPGSSARPGRAARPAPRETPGSRVS